MNRYACPQIDRLWTITEQLIRWERVERTVSHVIGHSLTSPQVPWKGDALARFVQLERQYGHDLAAFVETLREYESTYGSSDSARWLHFGLCSSDVVDVGWLLGMRTASGTLHGLVGAAITVIGKLEAKHAVTTLYRTHGQAAQTGAWSARWAGHRRALIHASRMMSEHLPSLAGFDGPTGTGGMLTMGQRREIHQVLRLNSRSSGEGRQAADRETWVTWLQSVASIATVCERFATDVRLLAHAGVDEVREGRPDTYRGSSSMPHKSNPTRSERICGLAPMVRALANGYAEAAASCWGSHSLEHSSAERIAIPQVTSLVGFILTEVANIAGSLVVDVDQVDANTKTLHGDSYEERNHLIEAGMDGGEAWSQVQTTTANLLTASNPYIDGVASGADWSVSTPATIFDAAEQRLRPDPFRLRGTTSSAFEMLADRNMPSTLEQAQQQQVEPIEVVATGTVTPNVSAADKHPELNNGADRDLDFDF